jgi:sugar O-acyltransferase (sialic acid O-acetyltransferase NeuD family)
MLVAGASRHAIDLLPLLENLSGSLVFFDDTIPNEDYFFHYKVINSTLVASAHFKNKSREFVLATGSPVSRKILYDKLCNNGGTVISIISQTAVIGSHLVDLDVGLNIMPLSFISNQVSIGKGVLINVGVQIHHGCIIGPFCELAPGSKLLGGVEVKSFSRIGSNSTILPDITIGRNATIGAGAVITKNIPDNAVVVGVPGKIIKYNNPVNF